MSENEKVTLSVKDGHATVGVDLNRNGSDSVSAQVSLGGLLKEILGREHDRDKTLSTRVIHKFENGALTLDLVSGPNDLVKIRLDLPEIIAEGEKLV